MPGTSIPGGPGGPRRAAGLSPLGHSYPAMGKRWVTEHRRDPYRRMARAQDFRSRASFKLLQLDKRFRLLHRGDVVLDLGCAPGGWSQVAAKAVEPGGLVVGVDLDAVDPVPGAIFVRGDLKDPTAQAAVRACLGGKRVDVVLSDMSPDISGAYDLDHVLSVELVRLAIDFGLPLLSEGGHVLVKVFDGPELGQVVAALRTRFSRVKRARPAASRKASSEVYVAALGYRGGGPPDWAAHAPGAGQGGDEGWPDDEPWPPIEDGPPGPDGDAG
jgi:23S rRNA (uridine2552-2'-O)-methyltransferase